MSPRARSTRALRAGLTCLVTLAAPLHLEPLGAWAQGGGVEDIAEWRGRAFECADALLDLRGRPHPTLTPEGCAERLNRALAEVREYGDLPTLELELIRVRHEVLTLPYVQPPPQREALWGELALIPTLDELQSALNAESCAELKRLDDREGGSSSADLNALLSDSEAGRAPLVKRERLCKDPGGVAGDLESQLKVVRARLNEQWSTERREHIQLKIKPPTQGRYSEEEAATSEAISKVIERSKPKRRAEARRRAARWVAEAGERLRALPTPPTVQYEISVRQRSTDWEVERLIPHTPGASASGRMFTIDASEESEGYTGNGEMAFKVTAPPGPLRATVELRAPLWLFFNGDYTCELSLSAEEVRALRWRTFQHRKMLCVSDWFGRRRRVSYRVE